MENEHGNSCSCKNGVGGLYQNLNEMDFARGPWNAASTGDIFAVIKYLKNGGDPNAKDSAGYTTLHYAASRGSYEICENLLAHGASTNSITRAGKSTALHRAASKGHKTVVELLLQHGACKAQLDADGKSPLQKALENNEEEIAEMLT